MARDHGRLLCRIWNDKDFRALPRTAQALYAQLLSQKEINNAGVLPLMLSKWAKGCDGLTQQDIIADLAALVDARFVAVDSDSEEVLVRSFIRNDGVLKQPNVFKNALRSAEAVESEGIRRVLASELRRTGRSDAARTAEILDPEEQGSEPFPNPFETTPNHVQNPPESDPPSPEENPSSNPSERVPDDERVSEPFAHPSGEGVGEGENSRSAGTHLGGVARAGAHVHTREEPPTLEEPPSPYCRRHPDGTDDPCGQCAERRKQRAAFDRRQADAAIGDQRRRAEDQSAAARQRGEDRAAAIAACPLGCASNSVPGYIDDGHGGKALCDHRPPSRGRAGLREQFEKHEARKKAERATDPDPDDSDPHTAQEAADAPAPEADADTEEIHTHA